MDFAAALRRLGMWLDGAGAEWAVVGGLALAVRGAGRLTDDVDVVTESKVREDLVRHLESLGYETLHVSRGYSNHAHRDTEMGRIDVVYVEGPTARDLFGEAEETKIFPGVVAKVPRAEHLVAMKLLAAKNDPGRRLQEMADIAELLRAAELDPESVRGYFERHGFLDSWEEIRRGL